MIKLQWFGFRFSLFLQLRASWKQYRVTFTKILAYRTALEWNLTIICHASKSKTGFNTNNTHFTKFAVKQFQKSNHKK